jgi:hypothetical protein
MERLADRIGFAIIVAVLIIVLLFVIVVCALSKPAFIGITLAVIFTVILVSIITGLIRIHRNNKKKLSTN